jgi:DNA-binding HxlR family transcriptional regulator
MYIFAPVLIVIMEPSEGDESAVSRTEQAASSVQQHDPRTVVEEYLYLLEDVPHIDNTPKESHTTVSELLDLVTNAYAMAILYQLFCEKRPLRFSELEAALDVSPKVLSQRLTELVESGLVSRQSYDEIPPRVEYEPTTKAKELDPAFQFLYAWAERYELDSK